MPTEWTETDERVLPLPDGGEALVAVYRSKGGSETMHSVTLPGGRMVDVRPSGTSGSVRGRVINEALAEVYGGSPDPVAYLVGRLVLVGVDDILIINPPKEQP